ncbi:MAG: hypothetical protein ACLQFW_11630, partial [Xanthobacteraceae bacterium]
MNRSHQGRERSAANVVSLSASAANSAIAFDSPQNDGGDRGMRCFGLGLRPFGGQIAGMPGGQFGGFG